MLNRILRGSRTLAFMLAMALVLSLAACDSDDPVSPEPPGNGDDNGDEPTLLSDILGERDDLSTLFTAVEESGQLNLTANPDADITVFAPNNSAFADINLQGALDPENEELLAEVVQYHVLASSALSSELSEGEIETAHGDNIRVTIENGTFFVNGNEVVDADIEADNGVLHVIDGLMLENRSLVERLGLTESTSQLVAAAEQAGVGADIAGLDNVTLFAPRNVQDEIDAAGIDFDEEDFSLADVLFYHVVNTQALVQAGVLDDPAPIDAETLTGLLDGAEDNTISVPTLLGDGDGGFETITITLNDDGSITFNNGQATLSDTDRFTDNFSSVFHVIDGVLLPPSSTEEDQEASFDLIANANDLDPSTGNVNAQCLTQLPTGELVFFNSSEGAIFAWDGNSVNEHRSAADLNADIEEEENSIDRCDGAASGDGDAYFVLRSSETNENIIYRTNVADAGDNGSVAFNGANGVAYYDDTVYIAAYDFFGSPNDGIWQVTSELDGEPTELAGNEDLSIEAITVSANGMLYGYSNGFGDGEFDSAIFSLDITQTSPSFVFVVDPYGNDSPLSGDDDIVDVESFTYQGNEYLAVSNNEGPEGTEFALISITDQSIQVVFTRDDLIANIDGIDDYVSSFTEPIAVNDNGEIFVASRSDGNEGADYIARVSNILP